MWLIGGKQKSSATVPLSDWISIYALMARGARKIQKPVSRLNFL
jgi:hypothetical protein